MQSFHNSLDELYAGTLDRERVATYGDDALLRVVVLENRQQVVKQILSEGWMAWREKTDEEGRDLYRLEVAMGSGVDLRFLRLAVALDLVAAGQVTRLKKTSNSKPLDVGLVYQIEAQPTGEQVVL